MTIAQEYREYCEREYVMTVAYLKGYGKNRKDETINSTIQNLLGAFMFGQHCGLDYERDKEIYEEYKEKIENLRG